MDILKHILAAGITAGIVTFGVIYAYGPSASVVPEPRERGETLGALAGPDINSTYLRWGGVATYRTSAALNTATTTPCALQSPAATSTLVRAALQINVGTTTQTLWTVAKAATPYATTTSLNDSLITLASGAQGTMLHLASTTDIGINGVDTIAPNQYIVWGVAGTAIADSSKLTGTCQAEFVAIP